LKVGAVLIRVLRAVQFSEQRIRVAWRRRTRASFETASARTVAKEVDYVGSVPFGLASESEIELLTSAILPVVALMLMSPVMFAELERETIRAADASCTRKYSPGANRAAERLFVGPARARS
jgi:hypothetical protein